MTSFGARFGVLIKTKRGEDRLTQQQVAEQAFEEGQGSKTAISDLERGKIAEPHQKTVDALVAFFDISAEELAACRETPVASVPELPSEFLEALGLSEALLFQLAAQFGHDNPRAGAAAYKAFLEQKAEEFRALEARLASLSEMEEEAAARERLDNQLKAARAAIADGAFEEADEILAAAEEVQQAEHTLREVRRQAALRTTRGEAALLNGDADTAHTHFAKAAAMFDPFDRAEAIEMRHKLEDRLYQHALRFGGRGFEGSAAILRSLLDTLDENAEAAEWARAQNSLAVALRNQGARTGGEAGAALLGEAVAAYRAALRVRTEEAHPVQWATTQNNLGVALRNQGERTGGEAGAALLGEAVAAYRAALRVCTEEAHPVHWAQTQNNLGTALSDQGARTGGEAGAALLAEAVSAYRAALRVRTEDGHPVDWATTLKNLGLGLRSLGTRMGGEAGAALLGEAVAACRAALRVFTEEAHPVEWAMTTESTGLIFESMAELEPEEARAHLEAASQAFEVARRVYDPEHMSLRFVIATEARDRVAGKLAGLG